MGQRRNKGNQKYFELNKMKHGGPVSSSTRRKLGSCNSLPTTSKKLRHWMTNHSSWTHTRGEDTANCCPQDWRHSPSNHHKESWFLKAEIHQGIQGWSRNTWRVPAAGGSVWTASYGNSYHTVRVPSKTQSAAEKNPLALLGGRRRGTIFKHSGALCPW